MKITAAASPNHGIRPNGAVVDTIVLHADASPDAARTKRWVCSQESRVSYHVLVDRNGAVTRFVETVRRAWHCGVSQFDGKADVNDFSVGLCFANKNDGVEEYTELQYQIGAAVVAAWMRVHPRITLERITTHAAIARCNKGCAIERATCGHYPTGRKRDPGPRFDMPRFLELVREELAKPPLEPRR